MFKISSERLGKIGDFFDAADSEKDGGYVLALSALAKRPPKPTRNLLKQNKNQARIKHHGN